MINDIMITGFKIEFRSSLKLQWDKFVLNFLI